MRQVSQVASGTLIAQALILASYPFVTRLYMPGEYGHFAAITAASQVFVLFSTMNLHGLIPAIGASTHSLRFASSMLLTSAMTLVLAIVGIAAYAMTVWITGVGDPEGWITAVAVALVGWLSSLSLTHRTLAIRFGQFRAVMLAAVARAAVFVGASLALGLIFADPVLGGAALALAFGAGEGVSAVVLRRSLGARHRRLASPIRVHVAWQELKRQRSLLLAMSWSHVLLSMTANLPTLLIRAAYGPAATGLFGLAFRVVSAPVSFFGQAVGDVLVKHSSELRRAGVPIAPFLGKISLGMSVIGVMGFSTLAAGGLAFSGQVLGEDWAGAGYSIAVLSLLSLPVFVCTALGFLPAMLGARRFLVFWATSRLVCLASGLFGCWWAGFGYGVTLPVYATIEGLHQVVFIWFFLRPGGAVSRADRAGEAG